MRFPVIPTVFLFLALISAAVLAPLAAPLQPQKARVEAAIVARTGLQVSVNGAVRLRFLPRPQLIAENVRLAAPDGAQDSFSAVIPVLVLDLDVPSLTHRQYAVSALSLLNARIEAALSQAPPHRLGGLMAVDRPRLQIINSRFAVTGLNRLDTARRLVLPRLSLTLAAGRAGAPLRAVFRHRLPDGGRAALDLRIAERRAQLYDVAVDLRLGPTERMAFDGFVSARASWRLDGELTVSSADALAQVAEHHLPVALAAEARAVSLSGLVRGDSFGLRSDNMEIEALDTLLQARLDLRWPQTAGELPQLAGRLSAGSLNLDLLQRQPASAAPPVIDSAWRAAADDLAMDLRLEANQFELGGERGGNLSLAFDWRDGLLDVDRLSADMPFRSGLIFSGTVNLAADRPSLQGSLSARSTDARGAMIWAGDRFGYDLAGLAEMVDPGRLQRLSLVGDIDWAADRLTLSGLTGRLDDDRLAGDIAVSDAAKQQADVSMSFSRFDFADWGMIDAGQGRTANAAAIWQPLNRYLESVLTTENPDRVLSINMTAEQLYSGTRALGPAALQMRLRNRQAAFDRVYLADLDGLEMTAGGTLNYDGPRAHGEINVSLAGRDFSAFAGDTPLSRFPLAADLSGPVELEARLDLTAPDAPGWPNARFVGSGTLGRLSVGFDTQTPSRSLDYTTAGSRMRVNAAGNANGLAARLGMPGSYRPQAGGDLQFEMTTQSNGVAALSGAVMLAGDKLTAAGVSRPSADGPRFEGTMEAGLADALPLLSGSALAQPLPLQMRAQINATTQAVGFAGLEAGLGSGQVTGEGVLQLDGLQPQLNASIVLRDVDFGWALPVFGKAGWSQAPMRWGLMGRANADLDVRAEGLVLGTWAAESLAGRLKLTEGVLEARGVELGLWGGRMTADVQAEGGSLNPYFNLEAAFENVGLAGLLQSRLAAQPVDAPMDGTLSLRGRGTSAAAMMASLGGDMQFEIGRGRLTFIDLDGEPDAGAGFMRGLGLVQIRDGRLSNATADFVMGAGRADGRLLGEADLTTRALAARMTLYPEGPDAPRHWLVGGTFDKPQVTVEGAAELVGAASAAENAPN